jgi:uncharacterized protein (DUF2336 family)
MNILVCGGRDYADAPGLNAELDAIHRENNVTRLIHGAARGADALAAAWALSRNIPTSAFPAYWATHGKAAGFRRNEAMLRLGRPGLVVAFPGGKGTAHMAILARASGVPVRQVIINQINPAASGLPTT